MYFIQDIKQAWRGLRGSPGFLFLTSGVLALGLATTIFMYGVAYTLLDKPPPYPNAEQLVGIRNTNPEKDYNDVGFTFLDFLDFKDAQRSFSELTGSYNGTMTISGRGLPERLNGLFVSEGYLRMLQVAPALGRGFRPADHVPGAAATIVLQHDWWRTRFNSDPSVIGNVIKLNGEPATIIGVMPQGFPLANKEQAITALRRDRSTEKRMDPNAVGVSLSGRLRDGVSLRQAEADIATIGSMLAQKYPHTNTGQVQWVATFAHFALNKDGVQIITILFYSVWAVLAIACANVASLLFVRANQRAYESSMRAALGASRRRLVMLTVAEGLIIAAGAVLGGLALAAIALDLMQRAMRRLFEDSPPWWTFNMDWRVVSFAVVAALLSGLLAGIWPAMRASRPNVMSVLRDGGRTGTGLRLSYFTSVMVVVEVALSVMLLAGSGVMTRTVVKTLNRDVGMSNAGVMTGRIMLPENAYNVAAQSRFWLQMVDQLRAIPGAQRVFATNQLPGSYAPSANVAIAGQRYRDVTDYPSTESVAIAPGFFAGIDRGLLAGRDFGSADRPDTDRVAIVNQTFVSRFLSSGNPIGQRIRLSPEDPQSQWLAIVGIAPDIRYGDDFENPGQRMPVVYQSLGQSPERFVSIAVQGSGDPHRFTAPMRRAVVALDPELPMYFANTLAERQAEGRGGMKIVAGMFSAFAGIAILLAAVGLYGVLAFTISRRVREIGIRRSLGARDGQILRSVLRSAMLQLAIGLGIGAILAPLLISALPLFVTGGEPHDPLVYGGVLLLVSACALLASWMPSARALRIQPAVALRYE